MGRLAAYPGKGPLAVFRTKTQVVVGGDPAGRAAGGVQPRDRAGPEMGLWLLQLLESSLRSASQQE